MEKLILHEATTDPLLECCLCRRLLQDAVLLNCLHNCCRSCFSTATANGSNYDICGLCGVTTHEGAVQPNRFIDYQVRRYTTFVESKVCGVCKRNGTPDIAPIVWCLDCQQSLCGDCMTGHTEYSPQHGTQSLKDLTNLGELCGQPSTSACAVHNEPLNIACLSCEQAKCISCWAECKEKKHEMHIVDEDPFDNYVGEVVACIDTMERELLRKFEALENPDNILQNMRAARIRHLEEMKQRKQRIIDAIEKVYQQLEFSENSIYDDLERESHESAAAADRFASSLLDARRYIHRLVESNDRCEILNQQKIVRGRLKVLSAELDNLSDSLTTLMTEVKLDVPLPEDLESVLRTWIKLPHHYSAASSSSSPRPQQQQQQCISSGGTSANAQLPVYCNDVALKNDEPLLLANVRHGPIELITEPEHQLTSLRLAKPSSRRDNVMTALRALSDGPAAVLMHEPQLEVLWRQADRGDRAPAGDGWIEDLFLDQVSLSPLRRSADSEVKAIRKTKLGELLNALANGFWLQLANFSGGRWLNSKLKRNYVVVRQAGAFQEIATGSPSSIAILGRWAQRLKEHTVEEGREKRLWHLKLSGDEDELPNLYTSTIVHDMEALWMTEYRKCFLEKEYIKASNRESADTWIRTYQESAKTFNSAARSSVVTQTEFPAVPSSKVSISKLMPVLTKEMHKFSGKLKGFAYYFGHDAQLTAYFCGENDDDLSKLKEELVLLLSKHIPAELVKVKVVNNMPNTTHCCGGVGSILTVGSVQQHVGLYLTYEGSDSIYWVSSAHGYLQELRAARPVAEGRDHYLNASEKAATPVKIRSRNVTEMPEVDVHILYLAYVYNGVPIQQNRQKFSTSAETVQRNVENAVQQITLCHSVDVLLGPTPLITGNLKPGMPFKSRLTSAVKDYNALQRSVEGYEQAEHLYKITRLRLFGFCTHDDCVTFDMDDLFQKDLLCYLGSTGQLAKGTVVSVTYNGPMTLPGRSNHFVAQNMLLIKPVESGCKAASGHSGSVWVQQAEDGSGFEAVAVTSATTQLPDEPDNAMWLATPLCACLLALSEDYPQRFQDYTKFDVVK